MIFDPETGEELVRTELVLGQPLRIPYRRDKPGTPSTFGTGASFDPENMTEDQATLVATVAQVANRTRPEPKQKRFSVDDLTPEQIEKLANRLPAIEIQPGYEDTDGQLKPSGPPLIAKLGGRNLLPPMKMEITSPTGKKTVTQGPLGGKMRVNMSKVK